jgi:hypothetical protein
VKRRRERRDEKKRKKRGEGGRVEEVFASAVLCKYRMAVNVNKQ